LNKVLAKSEAAEFRQALLSKRELDEQLALKQYMSRLEGYVDTVGDVIRQVKTINHDGQLIEKGDEISIAYQGRFLNGYVFEDSRDKAVIPSFIYGKEYQLLEGIHMGISGLKSGESVKIILPSRRAFGKEGSLAGIVPPYTAVIFDVNILKVEKHQ
jgi:FKBP-type peptidyl-prolyl cis-trans isomerase